MRARRRDDDIAKVAGLYQELRNCRAVGNELGMSEVTVRRYLKLAGLKGLGRWPAGAGGVIAQPSINVAKLIEFPVFPEEDIPTEELIDLACRRFATRKESHEAHTWFPIKIKENLPIGILWLGDPHVDDNGCNWPLLRKHAELCRKTEGLYGANIGDTTNNWAGRLVRLYAEQDASIGTARRFAKWLMLESGITWLVWLLGNHDAWGDGSEILAQMAKQHGTQKIVCHDWEARFRLVFPGGVECKIFAAHDHPGHSMWNPLHGQLKAAKFHSGIDLVIAGHKHNWGISQWEMPEQDSTPLMVRVRGYKHMDNYARRLGIEEQEEGQAILTIFNPLSQTRAGRVMAFADIEAGVDFLSFLRKRRR